MLKNKTKKSEGSAASEEEYEVEEDENGFKSLK